MYWTIRTTEVIYILYTNINYNKDENKEKKDTFTEAI